MNKIARQMGQKASMMTGTYGGIIGSIIITLFLVFVNPRGDASKFAIPAFRIIRPDTWGTLFTGWSAVGLIFILLVIAWRGVQAPYSDGIFWATIGCFVLLPIVGWLCNVVAMHFYPLTKEKMEEIQAEIGRIKAEAAAKQA